MKQQLSFAILLLLSLFATGLKAQQCCTGNISTYCAAGTSAQGGSSQVFGVGIPILDHASFFAG